MSEALLEAVRGLHVADPDLGVKPLLAKLREQQPDLGAGNKEVGRTRRAVLAELPYGWVSPASRLFSERHGATHAEIEGEVWGDRKPPFVRMHPTVRAGCTETARSQA